MNNLTSNPGDEKMARAEVRANVDLQKIALNKNMETAAWGFFLILLGGFMFVPDTIVKAASGPLELA